MHSFLFIIAMAASALAQNGPQAGTIRGYITDSEKRPISNVQVTLRSRAQITDSSQTDASGQFAFNRLSLDKYLLFVNAPGYVLDRAPGGSRISTSEGTGFPVEISRTHLNADVAVSLRRTTTIAGSVVDSDGKPALTGLVVLLKRSFDALGVSQLVAARPGAFVDATGQYAIDGVSEGEYFISAKSVRDRDHAGVSGVFPTTYYPGTTDVRNAATIVIGTNPTVVTGINMIISRDDRFSVAGHIAVVGEDVSLPVPEIHIAPALDRSDSKTVLNVADDKSNAFKIQNVGSGVYNLVAVVFRDGVNYTGRTQVDVHSTDVDNVKIVLERAADLNGRLFAANPEAGVNLSQVRVVLTDTSRTPSSLNAFGAAVSAGGSFKLTNIPSAEYVLTVSGLPPDHYVESARLDNEDILHRSFLITHTSRLDIMVNGPGGEITGHLINARGDRLNAAASIVLVPLQRSTNPLSSFKVTRSTDQGEFNLNGIRPGLYHVLAFEPATNSTAYYNEDFLRQYEYRGSPVTVVGGQVIKLDLPPIRVRLP